MRAKARLRAAALPEEVQAHEPPPLTKAQIRELERRVRDSEDGTRYLLASVLTERHALYYNVSEDTFGMGEPTFATLFKRREADRRRNSVTTSARANPRLGTLASG